MTNEELKAMKEIELILHTMLNQNRSEGVYMDSKAHLSGIDAWLKIRDLIRKESPQGYL